MSKLKVGDRVREATPREPVTIGTITETATITRRGRPTCVAAIRWDGITPKAGGTLSTDYPVSRLRKVTP